jgi:hypothetical protein
LLRKILSKPKTYSIKKLGKNIQIKQGVPFPFPPGFLEGFSVRQGSTWYFFSRDDWRRFDRTGRCGVEYTALRDNSRIVIFTFFEAPTNFTRQGLIASTGYRAFFGGGLAHL